MNIRSIQSLCWLILLVRTLWELRSSFESQDYTWNWPWSWVITRDHEKWPFFTSLMLILTPAPYGYFLLRFERVSWAEWAAQVLFVIIGALGLWLYIGLGKAGTDNERLGYLGDILPERIARTCLTLVALLLAAGILGGDLIALLGMPFQIVRTFIE